MTYWLVKSEPSKYSWEQFQKEKVTSWDGIRNYAARLHLKAMKKGDKVLFYHSNEGLEIVGIATVEKEYYQDPTTSDTNWVSVKLKALKKLSTPVSLSEMKKEKGLSGMALIRIGRLSVSPVSKDEMNIILKLAGDK